MTCRDDPTQFPKTNTLHEPVTGGRQPARNHNMTQRNSLDVIFVTRSK